MLPILEWTMNQLQYQWTPGDDSRSSWQKRASNDAFDDGTFTWTLQSDIEINLWVPQVRRQETRLVSPT